MEKYIRQLALRLAEELDEIEQGSIFAHFSTMPDSEIREELRGLKERIDHLKAELRKIF